MGAQIRMEHALEKRRNIEKKDILTLAVSS